MSPKHPSVAMMPPTSTLSPRLDSLQIPSQAPRMRTGRQHSSGPSGLQLPSLPRFHPANFPSSNSPSASGTPATNPNSPQPPTSPRSQQRQYSEAQRQLYLYQRELIANATRTGMSTSGTKPVSPRLNPLGSPGPVTPLELEGQGDYLSAGARNAGAANAQSDLVEKLIEEEARRCGEMSPGRPTSVESC
ncbi:hypothetical protein K490DRAFT_65705 [Saccharata proteae CBS 121410]|uniref:Uncharacterized protein n=1 Tax=Saccharata proteae CBS 121410 TaxID=1314787 RepID=A0A9P4LZW1_9PEZI|nr:hypothetical protein K490DRAFT_65705 [Saccharata proteae CBS 121410]